MCRIYEHQRHSLFKRSFVPMPIHLLVLFLLFIMSNLFYRGGGGGGAGSNLSILKEAKKNYMDRFIFSRGVGVYLLIPMPKKYTIVFLFLWPCSLAVPVLAGWIYAFCGSMSRNSRRLNWY